MTTMNGAGPAIPLRVAWVPDQSAGPDPAARVPSPPEDGRALDPAEAASWSDPDDALPDYANPSVLRAGDSGRPFTGAAIGGHEADLSGVLDPGCAGGDAGGD